MKKIQSKKIEKQKKFEHKMAPNEKLQKSDTTF